MMTQYEVSLSLAIMSESVPPSFAAVPCPPSCDTDFILVPIKYGLSIEIKYVKKRIIIIIHQECGWTQYVDCCPRAVFTQRQIRIMGEGTVPLPLGLVT
jgi:hypothetical protein